MLDAAYSDIEDVLQFVDWLDDQLLSLVISPYQKLIDVLVCQLNRHSFCSNHWVLIYDFKEICKKLSPPWFIDLK